MDINLIASELNERAASHPIGQLPSIRKRLKGREQLPRGIFSKQTIKQERGYAFHHGGRTELQFNVGSDKISGVEEFRFGVAFSFETSRALPDPNRLLPNVGLFNEYLQMYPEQFADMRMWHYVKNVPSGEYAPSAILPELVKRNVFVFLGKRQPTNAIDYEAILFELGRLLPLYEYVESGIERQSGAGLSGFEFSPGMTVRASSATATLAERQLNITLRHNLMQVALYRKLVAQELFAEVGDGMKG